jgi:hypothetical protein
MKAAEREIETSRKEEKEKSKKRDHSPVVSE